MTVSSRESKVGNQELATGRPAPADARSTSDSGRSTTDDRLPAAAHASRVIVEHVRPEIDGGRFPIKRTIGERVDVTADIFADGHDVVAAVLRDRPTSTAEGAKTAEKNLLSASYAPAAPKLASRTSSEGGGSAVQRSEWRETPMLLVAPGSDEWTASFDTTR